VKTLAARPAACEAVLKNIVTMEESAVSSCTPEIKRQLTQWVQKGQPAQESHVCMPVAQKQMVLAAGVIYTDYEPRGHSVNTKYIFISQARF